MHDEYWLHDRHAITGSRTQVFDERIATVQLYSRAGISPTIVGALIPIERL